MKRIVVLSGAGISAESGLQTFRDSNGLWNDYNVEEVASIEGWHRNKALVLEFYNIRRRELEKVQPNEAHLIIASLERDFNLCVVTQNVDNLHERAGSSNVIHLHGELTKACGERDKEHPIEIGYRDIRFGEKAPDGTQLRPFIVWFGEAVPLLERAAREVSTADILIIIGTSLNVYPAAGLVHYTRPDCRIYLIDPKPIPLALNNFVQIKEKATIGMQKLASILEESLKGGTTRTR